jgi:hypothetical protein
MEMQQMMELLLKEMRAWGEKTDAETRATKARTEATKADSKAWREEMATMRDKWANNNHNEERSTLVERKP